MSVYKREREILVRVKKFPKKMLSKVRGYVKNQRVISSITNDRPDSQNLVTFNFFFILSIDIFSSCVDFTSILYQHTFNFSGLALNSASFVGSAKVCFIY